MSYDNDAYVGINWSHWDATRSLVESEVTSDIVKKLRKLLNAAEVSEQSEQFCSGIKAAISVTLGVKVSDEIYPGQNTLFD
jgi:hypothetical protein